jgi:hypothetical protein
MAICVKKVVIFYRENNLKPTPTNSIYHKNERGKLPKKGFASIEKTISQRL